MSDLDSYLTRCYDLLSAKKETVREDEELCACANLIRHGEREVHSSISHSTTIQGE